MSTSMPAADPTVRLRLATQLHFALLRHCGKPVDVRTLPMGGDEARDALWVGRASGQPGHRPTGPAADRCFSPAH